MVYTVDSVDRESVVVNGQYIAVEPPFDLVPDRKEYEKWLNEVMTDVIETVRSGAEISAIKDHLARIAQGWNSDGA